MTHRQICFTRVSGQGSGDGWQAVNVSPELPQSAISSFTKLQNGNIVPPVFDNEDAERQIAAELQSDEEYTFLSRIECNASADDKGRQIMFAHSFVFPTDEFAENFADVLSVDEDNFKFNIEETSTPPTELKRSRALSVKECADSLGLSKESYLTMVQCVYQILDSKAKSSLHIVCDRKWETVCRYMTCIYAALPFEFRKKVSFSTYQFPNGMPKTVIFDRAVGGSGSYYLVADTQENNVLSDAVRRRMSKYEFMQTVPMHYAESKNFDGYFHRLEEKLDLFGSRHTTSLDLYKIAHDLLRDEQNDGANISAEELAVRLNELLSASISHPYLDGRIRDIVASLTKNEADIHDVIAEKLCKKLEASPDRELAECGYNYLSQRIARMGKEAGAEYLNNTFPDRNTPSFRRIKQNLNADEEGQKALNFLYTGILAGGVTETKDGILGFYAETAALSDKDGIQEILCGKIRGFIDRFAREESRPDVVAAEVNALLDAVFGSCPDMKDELFTYTKRVYWDNFNYGNILYGDTDLYKPMILENSRCYGTIGLLRVHKSFAENDISMLKKCCKALFESGRVSFTSEEKLTFSKKIIRQCIQDKDLVDKHCIDIWLCLTDYFAAEYVNPVKLMFENDVKPMTECFKEAYESSDLLQNNAEYRQRFVKLLTEYSKEKSDNSKAASEALHIIKDDEKQKEKEKKKKESTERKEAKESSEKGGFLSKFAGFSKKKNNSER